MFLMQKKKDYWLLIYDYCIYACIALLFVNSSFWPLKVGIAEFETENISSEVVWEEVQWEPVLITIPSLAIDQEVNEVEVSSLSDWEINEIESIIPTNNDIINTGTGILDLSEQSFDETISWTIDVSSGWIDLSLVEPWTIWEWENESDTQIVSEEGFAVNTHWLLAEEIRFDDQWRLLVHELNVNEESWNSAWTTREILIQLLLAWWWSDMSLILDNEDNVLFEQWKEQWYLHRIDEIFVSQSLQTVSVLTKKTIFEAYSSREENEIHSVQRIVIVVWNDWLLYVFDPSQWLSPQLFDEWRKKYSEYQSVQWYVQTEWYNPLFAEKEIIFQNDTQVVLESIRVDIPAQTIIMEDQWWDSTFAWENDIIVLQNAPNEFIIWDEKSHLAFSEPIRVEISTDLPQGTPVPLFVKHEGDAERWTVGLTTDASATCTDGISSRESAIGTVTDGKIVFWSCGASTFMVDLTLDIWGGLNGTVSAVALQSDGKYLAWWAFTWYDNAVYNRLIRFTTSWSVDSSFILGAWFNNTVNAIAVQSDGKILVWWSFTSYAWIARNRLVRLTSTWALDTSFVIGAWFNNTVNTLAIQSDWKVVVWWTFTSYAGTTQNRITRLTTTWALDTSFVIGAWFSSTVSALAVQSDGKIVIWWSFTSYSGTVQNYITRLTTTWTRDTSFIIGTAYNAAVSALALQSDGKIVVWWWFTTYSGAAYNRLVRLTTTWAADTSFVLGAWASSTVSALAIQPDGKIVLWWAFTTYSGTTQNRLTRVTTTWARDTSFVIGWWANNTVSALAIQWDGKIILWWTFTTYNSLIESRIVRINSTWTKDATVSIIWFDNFINAIVLQPDGKLIVGWLFTNYAWTAQNRIARLTTTWALDPTFVIWVGFNNTVNKLVLQPDGKILVWWTFTSYAGTAQNRITRLTSTWARDTSFVIWAGASSTVSAIVLQSDGKILIWWAFTSYAGTAQSRITRLTTTWARDTSFVIGAGASSTVSAIEVQPDGKILIWWDFTSYAGVAQNRITRLTTTWARDTSFVIGAWASSTVSAIALQPDWKIVIWWAFTSYSWTVQNRITRLTTTWERDTTFNIWAWLNSTVSTIAIQSDGKIVLWWAFTTYSGTIQNRLTRLTTTWLRDSTLNIWVWFDNTVMSIVSESPNKIIVWWSFLSFNMQAAYALARLFSVPNPVIVTPTSGQVITSPNVTLVGTGEPWWVVTVNIWAAVRTGAISMTWSWSVAYTWLSSWIKTASWYVDYNGNRSDTTVRIFSVTQGDVCIFWPVIAMTWIQATSTSQLVELQTDYFRVQDELWDFSGYYTTVSLSTLSGSAGSSIPTSQIEWKADPIQLLSWSANAAVVLWTGISTYSYATSSIVFMKRDPWWSWSWIYGTYGSKLRLRITIPAYQAVSTYNWTLTYTLYDN
jgi:uncharacterized delta-60 repeat protein